jgi:hypothetical protein
VSAAALAEALTAAEAALRRGDHAATAEAIRRGNDACAAMSASGAHPPPAALEALRAAHARCLALAEAELARLSGLVTQAALSRRAAGAYQR